MSDFFRQHNRRRAMNHTAFALVVAQVRDDLKHDRPIADWTQRRMAECIAEYESIHRSLAEHVNAKEIA